MDEPRRINATFPIETDNDLWEYLHQLPKKKRAGRLKFYARLGLMIQMAYEDADQLELLAIVQETISKYQRNGAPAAVPFARSTESRRKPRNSGRIKEKPEPVLKQDSDNTDKESDMFAGLSIENATVAEKEPYDDFGSMFGDPPPEVLEAYLKYEQTDPEKEETEAQEVTALAEG